MEKLLPVMDKHFKDIKFDKKFLKSLTKYRLTWANKNDDHIAFLGGNLLGVHPVRFSQLDYNNFYDDILSVDPTMLETDVHDVEGILPERKVSSNVLNVSLVYMIRQFLNSGYLSNKDKILGAKECYYVFAYKALGSLTSNYFSYNLDEATALLVHEKLNNRYLIKKLDTWQRLLEYRSNDVVDGKGLHTHKLKKFEAEDVVKIVNDLWNRIKEIIKYIYTVIIEVKESGESIKSESSVGSDIEGNAIVKDITSRPDKYVDEMINRLHEYDSLINDDYISLVGSFTQNLNEVHLKNTLKYMSDNTMKDKDVNQLTKDVLYISFDYLASKNLNAMDINTVDSMLQTLRGLWVSSRVNTREINKVKIKGDKVVKKAIKKTNKWAISSTRIGLFLYIYLRTVIKDNN